LDEGEMFLLQRVVKPMSPQELLGMEFAASLGICKTLACNKTIIGF
jgi:hypothetical protein